VSNYTKATNFATKDTLPSGNAGKVVKGTEIDTEFNAISSAIASKADTASPTFTGTPAVPTATAGANTTQIANTAFVAAAIAAGGGSVVQVVQSLYTGSSASTSTIFASTGHSVSITPTSASSKILIFQNGVISQQSYTNGSADTTLYRNNSVNLAGTSRVFSTVGGSGGTPQWANGGITYLDTPNTTSATTYTVYFAGAGSSNSVYNGSGQYNPTAMLVAMEILL
jgi:hypothetical protein